jgi:hypothetical protein
VSPHAALSPGPRSGFSSSGFCECPRLCHIVPPRAKLCHDCPTVAADQAGSQPGRSAEARTQPLQPGLFLTSAAVIGHYQRDQGQTPMTPGLAWLRPPFTATTVVPRCLFLRPVPSVPFGSTWFHLVPWDSHASGRSSQQQARRLPPHQQLSHHGGVLRLLPPTLRGHHLPQ